MFRRQRDFKAEIRSHLELEAERLRAQGLSPAEAEAAARRNFGDVGFAEERFRVGQPFAWLSGLGRDLVHGWRALLRSPSFLITAVGTLALAMGAVAGMFNVVNTVLLKPLPVPSPDRLVAIEGTAPGTDMPDHFDPGLEFYVQYKESSKLLDGITVYGAGTSTLRTDNRVERVPMCWPTNDMFATFGVRPQLGRLPVPEDEDKVVLISDNTWSSWFGRDPAVIGKTYYVSGGMREVIGVMPPEFQFPSDRIAVWIASPVKPGDIQPGQLGASIVARMKPGVTEEQLAQELTHISKQLPARYGGPPTYAHLVEKHQARVEPLLQRIIGPTAQTSLWLLLGAVFVVLLIACANVANLFLVRAEGRRHDLAIRRALGASRTQLIRLQLAEAFLVALVAGVLGVALAAVTLPVFVRMAPQIARIGLVHLDLAMVVATFGLVVLVALACGIFPALRASSPDLASMRDGGRSATGGRRLARNVLVVAQSALALVLLIGSALLVESFQRLRNVDPGYQTADLYTFQFAPAQKALNDGPSFGRMHVAFMDQLRALPGVTGVGIVDNVPLDEGTRVVRVLADGMTEDSGGVRLNQTFTGGDYFQVMGIRLLQGRIFTNEEATSSNSVAIVSRSAAAKLWPGENPIGKRLRQPGEEKELLAFTVVGLVEDVKQLDWRAPSEAVVYLPLTGPTDKAWIMGSPAYVIKSPRAATLTREVRELVHKIAPEAPVYREYTMDYLAQRSRLQLSFTMLTLGVVAGLALLLGAVGLYGVLSYVVSARTREIGLRMALGATPGNVRRQVVSQGTKVVLIGVVIGIAGAIASTRFLSALLYDVKALDPVVFAAMSLMMVAIGMLASYMPARRASKVDPMVSLRSE